VNWRYHREKLIHPSLALDPQHNLAVAAGILRACYDARADWWAAVGCYHAPAEPQRARRYEERVRRIWRGL